MSERTDILQLRLALAPFVREFLEQRRQLRRSQIEWLDTMPKGATIKLKLTMGECRAAVKASRQRHLVYDSRRSKMGVSSVASLSQAVFNPRSILI